mmetsp:Transcript_33960/g.66950  ORF Transcript_33960/g.66950 Transcript_33960/m.66950 type:complete len:203 (+) Transcript_33960:1366-1974(+)
MSEPPRRRFGGNQVHFVQNKYHLTGVVRQDRILCGGRDASTFRVAGIKHLKDHVGRLHHLLEGTEMGASALTTRGGGSIGRGRIGGGTGLSFERGTGTSGVGYEGFHCGTRRHAAGDDGGISSALLAHDPPPLFQKTIALPSRLETRQQLLLERPRVWYSGIFFLMHHLSTLRVFFRLLALFPVVLRHTLLDLIFILQRYPL